MGSLLWDPNNDDLYFSRLIVNNFDTLYHVPYELYEILVRRIFVDIIITIFCTLELDDESMARISLFM